MRTSWSFCFTVTNSLSGAVRTASSSARTSTSFISADPMLTCPLCKPPLFTVGRIFSAMESGTFTFTLSPFAASSTFTCRYRSPGPAKDAGPLPATPASMQTIKIPQSCFLILGKPPLLFLLLCTERALQMFRDFLKGGRRSIQGLGAAGQSGLLAWKFKRNSSHRRNANLQRVRPPVPRNRLGGNSTGIPVVTSFVVSRISVQYLAVKSFFRHAHSIIFTHHRREIAHRNDKVVRISGTP